MFRTFILLSVALSTVILLLDYQGNSSQTIMTYEYINLVCLIALVIECLAKIAAFGFINYLKLSGSNILDLSIVIIGIVDEVVVLGFLTEA